MGDLPRKNDVFFFLNDLIVTGDLPKKNDVFFFQKNKIK
jgi:hypothetical protein